MPSLLKRIFVQNFGLKVISLLLAIGLWLVVSRDPVGEVELKVPIEFRNVPQNLEIDSASFTEAQVRVRGPGRLIHRLRATDVRAEIDLASVKPGSRTFDLTSRNVRVPLDLEVVQIIPSQFQLSFDDRMTSSVEVRPRVTGISRRHGARRQSRTRRRSRSPGPSAGLQSVEPQQPIRSTPRARWTEPLSSRKPTSPTL